MPSIKYNGHTVNFNLRPKGESFVPTVNTRMVNITGDGRTETLIDFIKFVVRMDGLISDIQWEDYLAWFSWAVRGQSFSVELEASGMWSTTVEPGGDTTTLYVASTAGISPGDNFFVRNPQMSEFEINIVGTVASDHIVIADIFRPLKYVYPEGSLIRNARYYPKAVLTEKTKMFEADRSLARDTTAEGYRNVSFEFMEVP